MSTESNAVCAVCGTAYKLCLSCKQPKNRTSWRAITDTPGCYKIYMAVHAYTNKKISKKEAGKLLERCAMPSTLQPHIKVVMDEITGSKISGKALRQTGQTEQIHEHLSR